MMTNAISRGELWMTLLAPNVKRVEGLCPSVQAADGEQRGESGDERRDCQGRTRETPHR